MRCNGEEEQTGIRKVADINRRREPFRGTAMLLGMANLKVGADTFKVASRFVTVKDVLWIVYVDG